MDVSIPCSTFWFVAGVVSGWVAIFIVAWLAFLHSTRRKKGSPS